MWSFGVVLWDIFSLTKVPYVGLIVDDEFIRRLENGYHMERRGAWGINSVPEDIGQLMTDCWKPEPNQRPTFSQLAESLTAYMEASVLGANYIKMMDSRQYLQMTTDSLTSINESDAINFEPSIINAEINTVKTTV